MNSANSKKSNGRSALILAICVAVVLCVAFALFTVGADYAALANEKVEDVSLDSALAAEDWSAKYKDGSGASKEADCHSIASYFESSSSTSGTISFTASASEISACMIDDNDGQSGGFQSMTNGQWYKNTNGVNSGECIYFACVNVKIPDNLSRLFKLGLVSQVSFTVTVGSHSAAIDDCHSATIVFGTSAHYYHNGSGGAANYESNPFGWDLDQANHDSAMNASSANEGASITNSSTLTTSASGKTWIQFHTVVGHDGAWAWFNSPTPTFIRKTS